MGYQITWKTKDLPEEEVKEYTPTYSNRNYQEQWSADIRKYKLELIIKCLNSSKDTFQDVIISMAWRYYKRLLEDEWKWNLVQQLKNNEEVWFCGWEYSKPCSDDYTETLYENLMILCGCCRVADPIEDEEYFESKQQRIEEQIESLEEEVRDTLTHQFIDKYRKYSLNYKEEIEDAGDN